MPSPHTVLRTQPTLPTHRTEKAATPTTEERALREERDPREDTTALPSPHTVLRTQPTHPTHRTEKSATPTTEERGRREERDPRGDTTLHRTNHPTPVTLATEATAMKSATAMVEREERDPREDTTRRDVMWSVTTTSHHTVPRTEKSRAPIITQDTTEVRDPREEKGPREARDPRADTTHLHRTNLRTQATHPSAILPRTATEATVANPRSATRYATDLEAREERDLDTMAARAENPDTTLPGATTSARLLRTGRTLPPSPFTRWGW